MELMGVAFSRGGGGVVGRNPWVKSRVGRVRGRARRRAPEQDGEEYEMHPGYAPGVPDGLDGVPMEGERGKERESLGRLDDTSTDSYNLQHPHSTVLYSESRLNAFYVVPHSVFSRTCISDELVLERAGLLEHGWSHNVTSCRPHLATDHDLRGGGGGHWFRGPDGRFWGVNAEGFVSATPWEGLRKDGRVPTERPVHALHTQAVNPVTFLQLPGLIPPVFAVFSVIIIGAMSPVIEACYPVFSLTSSLTDSSLFKHILLFFLASKLKILTKMPARQMFIRIWGATPARASQA
ncbi:hypothetical protein FB451DRAFT_1364276 [Mycena latifolia]|nr:hypothetical protein FB451DRAFT_1364276 [Mycena latifolia]